MSESATRVAAARQPPQNAAVTFTIRGALAACAMATVFVVVAGDAAGTSTTSMAVQAAEALDDQFLFGDADCNGSIGPVDALVILRAVAGIPSMLPVPLVGTCPGPAGIGNTTQAGAFGDADCSGMVNAVDALKLLRYIAGMAYARAGSCPNIGDSVTL